MESPFEQGNSFNPTLAKTSGVAKRVLIVDDSQDAARSLAALIEHWGHTVATAFDGTGAVEKARTFLPDVALLDISLPDMDGYEIAQKLRGDVYLTKIRLFAVTGYGLDGADPVAQAAGFENVFVKPIDFEQLQKALA
jgi:CheY-like chemotaxis protein